MATYGQFCPVSKAAEVLCSRWTVLVVREVLNGSSRFSEMQRFMPACPPATLSKRLKELVAAGVLRRVEGDDGVTYEATEAGWALFPILEGMGQWAQRWARSTYEPDELDADLLLWNMQPFLDPNGLGVERAVIEVALATGERRARRFWMVVDPGEVDVCKVDPERPVDVVLESPLRTLTQIWMGDDDFADAVDRGDVVLQGPRTLTRRIPRWIGQHPIFAAISAAG